MTLHNSQKEIFSGEVDCFWLDLIIFLSFFPSLFFLSSNDEVSPSSSRSVRMKENENNDDRSSLDCHFSSFSHKQILVRRLLLIRHFKQDLSPFSSHQTSWINSFHALASISCRSSSSSPFSWPDDLSHHYIICILVLSMPWSSGRRKMCEVQTKNPFFLAVLFFVFPIVFSVHCQLLCFSLWQRRHDSN